MSTEELLSWGESHHYPYLQLPSGGLPHGEEHWRRLLQSPERTREARERVLYWLSKLEVDHAA